MDIDFYLAFGGCEIVLGEFKQQGGSMSYGQKRALTVLTMATASQGIEI
ncbi:hypothetical protein [Picosynechococcus sp. NKBG15041c]|nr:hypothetical protein [Picosynechococcus sp. NKBG15041c]